MGGETVYQKGGLSNESTAREPRRFPGNRKTAVEAEHPRAAGSWIRLLRRPQAGGPRPDAAHGRRRTALRRIRVDKHKTCHRWPHLQMNCGGPGADAPQTSPRQEDPSRPHRRLRGRISFGRSIEWPRGYLRPGTLFSCHFYKL